MQHTKRPVIRFARPDEGPVLQAIFHANELLVAGLVDWAAPLGPYWLVAEYPSVVGCIMVNPGTPIGRLDLLAVLPTVTPRKRAQTVKYLCYAGFAVLKQNGSQLLMTGCAIDNPLWKRVQARRNMVFTETIQIGLKRL